MGYYDGKGIWREDGEGGYDYKGYWRNPGEGGYDGKGYWRNPGEGSYDSKGIWRENGEGGYDGKGYWRDGQHSSIFEFHGTDNEYTNYSTYSTESVDSSIEDTGSSHRLLDILFAPMDILLYIAQKLLTVAGVFVIILLVVFFSLTYSGILRAKVIVSLDLSDDCGFALEDMELTLVSMSGKHKEYTSTFDLDTGSCTIKVPRGEYTLYFEYQGEKYSIQTCSISGFDDLTLGYTESNLMIIRLVEISFKNDSEEVFCPDGLSIMTESGEDLAEDMGELQDGIYLIMLDNSCGEQNWIISADGYESVNVSFDGEAYRVFELEVTMSES